MRPLEEVYVNTIRQGRDLLVAVCDAEILGMTLKGGRTPFEVSERFYKGTLCCLTEAIEAMGKATIVNMVGVRIVKAAIEYNLVQEAGIIYLGDVPHAQIVHL
ncbi:MAG: DUF424 family protein [Candidatus Bathyarchaeota archaeon]|nr:DUF424 family protein [Candidatus Bathyarchaeota archaeon]MDP7207714.1 DUF424 family protein [Candidatus Bathyarchaeota archaeon]